MDIGMLWFDNDHSTSFSNKVKRARTYYHKKYGKVPDICYVHPSMIRNGGKQATEGHEMQVDDVLVAGSKRVLPHHFWIGVSNGKE